MNRRDVIILLGGAAAAGPAACSAIWPLAARAQQMPVIGLLDGQASAVSKSLLAAFRQGLAEAGFAEGRNLAIVYRSAEGDIAQLPALAAELVTHKVEVIAAVGGDKAVLSAKAATATIPIVFTTGGDPVGTGFVASINRPGGNVTGTTFWGSIVAPKQIGLLRDIVPGLATIGLLLNPANPMTASVARDVQAAADSAGLKVIVVEASSEGDIEAGFAQLVAQRIGALVIGSAVFFNRNRDRLVALAARHAIPAVFNNRDFPAGGGLMSYGSDTGDSYRQAGVYVGRILKGEKPGDLPVMQPTRFQLVINLKTAKALGLDIPPTLLALADEVIE
jgi:putative tryptophan/tyrosine transport system substrate-binding protein